MKNFFTKSLSSAIAVSTLFVLQCINAFGQNETNTWIQKTDFGGTARKVATGFSINGKGYILTGNDGAYEQDMWEWDQVANTWTQKADFAGGVRGDAVGFAIGNKGYVVTGGPSFWEVTNDFWEWDQPTNTWIQKADFAGAARTRATGFAIGTKGYVTTGYDGSFFNDLWEWDQATDTWTEKSDFPGSPRWDAVGFSIGAKGYVGCGYDGSSIVGDFWEYDQATDTWTEKADVGGDTRSAPIGFSINGKGYIGLGATDPSAVVYLNDFWQYDPATDTWTAKANYGGPGRADKVGFAIDNVGYIGTGYNETVSYKDFWEYSPDTLIIYNTHTNLTCGGGNNGQAAVSVSGGTSPYTYHWTGGQTASSISGLAAGTYTCTVTDAAAVTQTSSITVGPVPPVSVAISGTRSICNGSSTTLTAGGADSYTWAPGTGLSATTGLAVTANPSVTTTYTVSGTVSGGCTGSNIAIITVTQSHFANAGNDTSIYVGLSALIGGSPSATGGTPPYIYAWSPSIGLSETDSANVTASPPTTTTYVLNVTDSNACTSADTMVLTIKPIPIDILERIAGSKYIFEGLVINSTSYWSNNGGYIYTANTIVISKVLKGSLECGTVEMITKGGTVDSVTAKVSHALHLAAGNEGVFLCDSSELDPPATHAFTETNTVELDPLFEENSFVKYWWDGEQVQASDQTHSYGSVDNVYTLASFAATEYSDSWTNCTYSLSLPQNRKTNQPKDTTHSVLRVPTNNKMQSNPNYVTGKINNHPKYRGGPKVFYSMSSVSQTMASVLFDIDMASDSFVYLNGAEIYLQYDTAMYGSNISTKATVYPGALLIADPTTYPSSGPSSQFAIQDIAPNIVALSISARFASDTMQITSTLIDTFTTGGMDTSYYRLDTAYIPITINQSLLYPTAQQLFTISIPIVDCHPRGRISFTDQVTEMLPSSTFAYTSDEYETISFDDISATQTISFTPCYGPEIKSFWPTTIDGGVYEVLTVNGYDFDSTKGNGNFYFKNADDGGKSEIALNYNDYISWSDTLIQIRVPSINDTVIPAPTGQPKDHPVGSGHIRLVNNDGLSATSSDSLTILYSIYNRVLNGSKRPELLTGPNLLPGAAFNRGYKFYVDTVIWNNPHILACVKKAMRDWTCLTKVNWQVDSFYTFPFDSSAHKDSINFIHFGKTNQSNTEVTLALTTSFGGLGCAGHPLIPEIDMVISNNPGVTWDYDTTGAKVDTGKDALFDVLLHEFGHAQLLNHVNDTTATMYYLYPRKGASASQRKINLANDASCAYGGNKVMQWSINTDTFPKCKDIYHMVPDSICASFINGIKSILENNELLVYPNPTDDKINVDFSISSECKAEFILLNMYGQEVTLLPASEFHRGKNTITLSLEGYPAGIYILHSKINDRYFESKIVHLNNL